jgi:hypothetical protein
MAYLHTGKGYDLLPSNLDAMTILKTLETIGVKQIQNSTQALLAIALIRNDSIEALAETKSHLGNSYGLSLEDIFRLSPSGDYIWTALLPNVPIFIWQECGPIRSICVSGANSQTRTDVFVSLLNQQKDVLAAELAKRSKINLFHAKPEQLVPEAWAILDGLMEHLSSESCPLINALTEWRVKRDSVETKPSTGTSKLSAEEVTKEVTRYVMPRIQKVIDYHVKVADNEIAILIKHAVNERVENLDDASAIVQNINRDAKSKVDDCLKDLRWRRRHYLA